MSDGLIWLDDGAGDEEDAPEGVDAKQDENAQTISNEKNDKTRISTLSEAELRFLRQAAEGSGKVLHPRTPKPKTKARTFRFS